MARPPSRIHLFVHVLSAILLALSAPAALAQANEVALRTIAVTGTRAPGAPDAKFDDFSGLTIGRYDQVAFQARLTGGVVEPGTIDRGLWVHRGGALELVARCGAPAPGTEEGVVFHNFHFPRLDPLNSDLAFWAQVTGPGIVSEGNEIGIWRGSKDHLSLVIRRGDTAPPDWDGYVMDWISDPLLAGDPADGKSTLFFTGTFRYGSNPSAPALTGLWMQQYGELKMRINSNFFDFTTDTAAPQVNSSLTVELLGSHPYYAPDGGIYVADDFSGVIPYLKAGTPAPGLPEGWTFGNFSAPALSNWGLVAFQGRAKQEADGPELSGIWSKQNGGDTELVALEGSPAPGGGVFGPASTPMVAGDRSEGAIAFITPEGLYRGRPGQLAAIARQGEPAPRRGEGFAFGPFSPGSAVMNTRGELAFLNVLSGGATTRKSIWFADRQGYLTQIARVGERLSLPQGQRTISNLHFYAAQPGENAQPTSLNASGQIVFLAYFTDGSSAVMLAKATRYPAAYTQDATEITQTTAALHGFVVAGGLTGTAHFEYGPTKAYGSQTPDVFIDGRLYPSVSLQAPISDLEPSTTYHMRLVMVDGSHGDDSEFVTRGAGDLLLPVRGTEPVIITTADVTDDPEDAGHQIIDVAGDEVYGKAEWIEGWRIRYTPRAPLSGEDYLTYTLVNNTTGGIWLTNPFLHTAGEYHVPVRVAETAAPVGMVRAKLTKAGAVSGSISLLGESYSFKGLTETSRTFSKRIQRVRGLGRLDFTLAFSVSPTAQGQMTATVKLGDLLHTGQAIALMDTPPGANRPYDRNTYEFARRLDGVAPAGAGFALSQKLGSTGTRLVGRLPDGSPFLASARLRKDFAFDWYLPLPARPAGVVSSTVKFSGETRLLEGALDFARGRESSGYSYRTQAKGTPYLEPPSGQGVLTSYEAKDFLLRIQRPGGAIWEETITVDGRDRVTARAAKLTIDRKTGAIFGAIKDSAGRPLGGITGAISLPMRTAAGIFREPAGVGSFELTPAP